MIVTSYKVLGGCPVAVLRTWCRWWWGNEYPYTLSSYFPMFVFILRPLLRRLLASVNCERSVNPSYFRIKVRPWTFSGCRLGPEHLHFISWLGLLARAVFLGVCPRLFPHLWSEMAASTGVVTAILYVVPWEQKLAHVSTLMATTRHCVNVDAITHPFSIPWTVGHQAPPSMSFPSKITGVGCHLLQGIFLTQGSNPSLLPAGKAWKLVY